MEKVRLPIASSLYTTTQIDGGKACLLKPYNPVELHHNKNNNGLIVLAINLFTDVFNLQTLLKSFLFPLAKAASFYFFCFSASVKRTIRLQCLIMSYSLLEMNFLKPASF